MTTIPVPDTDPFDLVWRSLTPFEARAEKVAREIREREEGDDEGALICKIAL